MAYAKSDLTDLAISALDNACFVALFLADTVMSRLARNFLTAGSPPFLISAWNAKYSSSDNKVSRLMNILRLPSELPVITVS